MRITTGVGVVVYDGCISEMKPAKPSPDFPLFPHDCGKWAKKIKGQMRYFGRWDDPAAALAEYQRANPPLDTTDTVSHVTYSLQAACNQFLDAKRHRLDAGDLSPRTWDEYLRTAKRLVTFFGPERDIASFGPDDFATYRTFHAKTLGLIAIGNEITRVKTLFKWLSEQKDVKTKFGPDFRKASAKSLRRHRREAGKKLFTREQINLLMDEAGLHLRAMIWLGINCGFGNTDCATMPLDAVDLATGWIDYPRTKTEVDRLVPLWPETVNALRESLRRRYKPSPENEGLFFVRPTGAVWQPSDDVSKQFRACRGRAVVRKGGFYWLRHTFETIGGGAKDQVAVNAIMGHVDGSMAANYRQEIDPSRLESVTAHVRAWLLG